MSSRTSQQANETFYYFLPHHSTVGCLCSTLEKFSMTSAVKRSQNDLSGSNEGDKAVSNDTTLAEAAAAAAASLSLTDSGNGNNSNTCKFDQSLVDDNESAPGTPLQVHVHVSEVASCPEIRNASPSSSPQPSPKMQQKFVDKRQSSPSSTSSVSREVSAEKLAELELSYAAANEDTISRSSESNKSADLQRSGELALKDLLKDKKGSDKKKKGTSWYSVLNPTYKSRSDDFKRLFKDLPEHERLVVDYSCALQKDILVQGRLYISQNYICFYANIFRWETMLILQWKDVTGMTKEKTARVIPNAIQVCTDKEKHFFTSFGTRDKTYLMLFRVWQNALMEQPMSIQELWQWVHYSYGEELGLTSDDDDYVAPCAEDDTKNNNGLLALQDGKELLKSFSMKSPALELCPEMGPKCYMKESPNGSTESQGILNGCGRDINDIADASVDKTPSDKLPISLSKVGSLVDPGLPTDLSDTTESDNDMPREVFCPCEAHFGKEIINVVYPMSVEQIFKLIFTDSKFYFDFLHSRKTSDIVQSPWQEHAETNNKLRQVNYTLTLNLSMGPKTAQTTETQTMLNVSKPGSLYIIDVDAVNTGVPYSDNFYTSHRYCITQVSPSECRLRIHSQIKYRKSVWAVVKTFIEKNVMQGVEEYLRDLEMVLHKECVRSKQQIHTKKGMKRRRPGKQNSSNPAMTLTDGKTLHGHSTVKRISTGGQMEFSLFATNPDILIKIMLCVLIALLFLNALLYYKLWSLETQASKMVLPPSLLDLEILKNSPRSQEEWAKLVQHQETLHQVELQKWTEILQSAVELLQQTEDSLNSLQKNIRPYQMQRVLQLFSNSASASVPEDS